MLIRQRVPVSEEDRKRAAEYRGMLQRYPAGSVAAVDHLLASASPPTAGSLVALAEHWLAQGQAGLAAAWLDQIVPRRHSGHDEVHIWALAHWQQGQVIQARAILAELLRVCPLSWPGVSLLAELERSQGRLDAAAGCIMAFAAEDWEDVGLGLTLLGFLSDSRRPVEAMAVAEKLLTRGDDPRIHAMASQMALQLGRFDAARDHARAAIAGGIDLNLYYLPRVLSMCQRYQESGHADIPLFRDLAKDLKAPAARASLHFALGKACDDLGDYRAAAEQFRAGNALARPSDRDPVAEWLALERAMTVASPLPVLSAATGPVPVFIVGLPRTGSTLLASRLSLHDQVCDRGELPTIAFVYRRLQAAGRWGDPVAMGEAAALYRQHLQQDGRPAGWYIDKEPMNFGYLGLIHALLPQAKVIWCRRGDRDTALSIWMQHFSPGSLDYAYDFGQVRHIMDSASRMLMHWKRHLPASMLLEVFYEDMVQAPQAALQQVYRFLGLPGPVQLSSEVAGAVGTSSAWQVRQPIHRGSVDKSRHYLPWIPELSQFG